jgi:hypothetical protein
MAGPESVKHKIKKPVKELFKASEVRLDWSIIRKAVSATCKRPGAPFYPRAVGSYNVGYPLCRDVGFRTWATPAS